MPQVNRLARELLEWSKAGSERLTETIQREVRRQLKSLGLVTREDFDALRKRVRELERGSSSSASKRSSSSAKKSSAKRDATAT
jgi:polyhydroxyalkanoate synthesis regulator phasin